MGITAQKEICCICNKPIGTKEKMCIYVGGKGFMHESCNIKWKEERYLVEDKE